MTTLKLLKSISLALILVTTCLASVAVAEERCAENSLEDPRIIAYSYVTQNPAGERIVEVHAYLPLGVPTSEATLIVSNHLFSPPLTIRGTLFCIYPRTPASITVPAAQSVFFQIDDDFVTNNGLQFERGYAQVYILSDSGTVASPVVQLNLGAL